jgi:Eukaryotic aspartyl protease
MKYLFEIAALCSLAVAMRFPERSSALSRRSHSVSPYSTYMKRQRHSNPHPRLLHRHQTVKSQNIVDDEQVRFLIPITWGGQTLDAEFDTGSTDVWLAQSGFTCYSGYSQGSFTTPIDSSNCNFPNTYTLDSSFSPYDGVTFTDCYGSGNAERCVSGQYGSVDVTIAGLTILGQSVGSASEVRTLHT